ncbi:acetyltransferase, GNAT family [Acetobacteraceae bacterium AT-5844]|nr:acetyltransferase, GNAT family [Acetobacteraceae bacterium AT-5844]
MTDTLRFELIEDRAGPEVEAIRAGLEAHRTRALGFAARSQPLCLVHRDSQGHVQAGLVGEVVLSWLYVEKFWVDESLRGQGIGSGILAQAEEAARARGAVGVHLNTSSFQAPEFYKRQGYVSIGGLAGRPEGHARYWFAKRFDGQDPRAREI